VFSFNLGGRRSVIIGLIVVFSTLGVACSSNEDGTNRDRNVLSDQATPSCKKLGEVKAIAGVQSVCGQATMAKNAPKQWFPVAQRKKWACKKPGIPRMQNGELSVCGVVKKQRFWHTVKKLQASTVSELVPMTPSTAGDTSQTTSPAPDSNASVAVPVSSGFGVATGPTSTATTQTTLQLASQTTQVASQTTAASTTGATLTTTLAPPTTMAVPAENLKVGDTGPGGGIVFLTPTSEGNLTGKYFEASSATWFAPFGCLRNTTPNQPFPMTQQQVGAAATNHATLRSSCADWLTSAARYANSMTDGPEDWYLPTVNELTAMYASMSKCSRCAKTFGKNNYWSSTVPSGDSPYILDFGYAGGMVREWPKEKGAFIRAIRSFQ
jgi:hypothetical protein